jgi:hypothetical protein
MVPANIRDAILHHVFEGQECGGFVTAVLENNLQNAIIYADDDSLTNLRDIAMFCRNVIPGSCWGSADKVRQWRNRGGDPDAYLEPYSVED